VGLRLDLDDAREMAKRILDERRLRYMLKGDLYLQALINEQLAPLHEQFRLAGTRLILRAFAEELAAGYVTKSFRRLHKARGAIPVAALVPEALLEARDLLREQLEAVRLSMHDYALVVAPAAISAMVEALRACGADRELAGLDEDEPAPSDAALEVLVASVMLPTPVGFFGPRPEAEAEGKRNAKRRAAR